MFEYLTDMNSDGDLKRFAILKIWKFVKRKLFSLQSLFLFYDDKKLTYLYYVNEPMTSSTYFKNLINAI